ncbi:threonine synthase [Psychrobacter sanguinis]|uniref:threonine synthase n=1 Tax=Psychrobacter sanguinis TaxID=861445 RepID=UPI00020C9453|nr:threonine synthase [Psychrobacter sanguinis]EGK12887.1 threonine synthase [Psychrobacter sp. 1501(2011)]MCC3309071.1 threonine synthase [Psychrobacter sanguinis]MCD9150202.1 threonine synthase [Psychrobacter sanguinis]UEC26355.1 threonine synthase [Psychrobacter sanguinis]
MKYISTRGQTERMDFSDVLLMGLAPDGGLMLPESYPQVDSATLNKWRKLSYPELAFEIMRLFATDIDEADLKDIINRTYTKEVFGSDDIVPVRQLEDDLYILGLSNGPTLAFKDVAMQFLGNAFEYVLKKKGKRLTIIGATSGDTGSAAEYALRGKDNIEVFMMSPHGKMSEFQRAQMYSLTDANIHNIAIKGMFDDCQDIVKALQQDADFKAKYSLGTVNSINWGRILAQIVYYFKAYFAVTDDNEQKISFCVPSGNFGNICAGHIAREMGLPVDRLIVATNENDVLNDFFNQGVYTPRPADKTYVTSSPSMDISKASNFERFVYLLLEKDSNRVHELFDGVKTGKGFDLSDVLDAVNSRYGFAAGKSTHQDRLNTIKSVYENYNDLIDPHTADGVKVARELQKEGEVIVCAETALPVKFSETIFEAVGEIDIERPEHTKDIESLEQHVTVLDNDASLVADEIRAVVSPV